MSKISVVIPTYNRKSLIIETLRSVESQTLSPQEVIVVDDHSEDDTIKTVMDYAKNSRLNIGVLLNERHKGVSGARNWGAINAKGDFIAFLDSDDLWLPNHLQQLSACLEKYPQVDVAFSAIEFFGEATDIDKCTKESKGLVVRILNGSFEQRADYVWISTDNLLNNVLIDGVPFRCQGSLIRKRIFCDNNLLFAEDVTYTEDGLFFIMAAFHSQFLYVDKAGVCIRRHSENDQNISYGRKISDSCDTMVIKLKNFFKNKELDVKERMALKQCLTELQYDALSIRANTGSILLCVKEALRFIYRIRGWASTRMSIKLLIKMILIRLGFLKDRQDREGQ